MCHYHYRPSKAQENYEERRKNSRRKKLLQEGETREDVIRLLVLPL